MRILSGWPGDGSKYPRARLTFPALRTKIEQTKHERTAMGRFDELGLTRRQEEIYQYLLDHLHEFPHPPTLDELCQALGLRSRGSLHKQLQALVKAGLIEPMNNKRRGVRLAPAPEDDPEVAEQDNELPFLGRIAAGRPIEAVPDQQTIAVPPPLRTDKPCYVLEVQGDSMIDMGILDGDWVVIEQRDQARNGEVVVALIDDQEATLKRLEYRNGKVVLHPENARMQPMTFEPGRVRIQGVLVGQMRRYH